MTFSPASQAYRNTRSDPNVIRTIKRNKDELSKKDDILLLGALLSLILGLKHYPSQR